LFIGQSACRLTKHASEPNTLEDVEFSLRTEMGRVSDPGGLDEFLGLARDVSRLQS
jgi:hypothetical protein